MHVLQNFLGQHKPNSFLLGLIQPSSHTIKELHDLLVVIFRLQTRLRYHHRARVRLRRGDVPQLVPGLIDKPMLQELITFDPVAKPL